MRKLAPVACLLVMGSACSSAAAPGAENAVAQKAKATKVAVEAALRSAVVAEQAYFVETQTYTAHLATLEQVGFNPTSRVDVRIAWADGAGFCLDSTSAGDPIHAGTPELAPLPGACA
jgi:hypothetical protein